MNMFAYIVRNVAQTSLNPNIAFNSSTDTHYYTIHQHFVVLALIEKKYEFNDNDGNNYQRN